MQKDKIVIRPLLTEKSNTQKEKQNKYIFKVHRSANKIEIKNAVESLFRVHVKDVNTAQMRGKKRRLGAYAGRLSDWKKAIITLQKGESIKLVEEV
ncbi:50S ribosomal protein L23 [bacterium]